MRDTDHPTGRGRGADGSAGRDPHGSTGRVSGRGLSTGREREPGSRAGLGPATRRGQTGVDFVVGLGVFLLAVTVVAGFVPQLFASFDDSPERPLVADRTADRLVADLSTDDLAPSVVNETCAITFLRQDGTACGFDTATDVHAQLGVGSRYRIHVSLRRNQTADPGAEVLCTDGSTVEPCPGGDELAVGPSVPADRSSVTSTRRVVTVGGRDAVLVVSVW